jgi:hypothetical protein
MPDTSQVGKHFNRLIVSNDSGKTWQKINISEMKSIYSAWFKNKDTGFLGGSNGIISKSYNIQNNRGQQLTGIASDINGLSFYNKIGLAVSYGGTILRTENNGGFGLSLKNPGGGGGGGIGGPFPDGGFNSCFNGVSGSLGIKLSLALKYDGCSLFVGCSTFVIFVLFKFILSFNNFDVIKDDNKLLLLLSGCGCEIIT